MRTCSTTVIAIVMLATSSAYGTPPPAFDGLKPGDMQPAHSLITKDFDNLCVLTPYQDRLANTYEFSNRVNEHLSKAGYHGDEGDLAIVLVRSDDVELIPFRRSLELDIDASILKAAKLSDLPKGFTPSPCADHDNALFGKIERDGRTYIVLGKLVD